MKKEFKKKLQKSNKLNRKRLKEDQKKKNEKRSITENCIKFYKKNEKSY